MDTPTCVGPRGRAVTAVAASLVAAVLWVLLATIPGTVAGAGQLDDERESPFAAGAAAYDFHCATCHGATGAGFEEARSRFPADHASCSRCHGPLNPPQMSAAEMDLRQTAFSIGDPPPLNDHARLARFGSGGGLERYISAAMPRWNPGSLGADKARDVTLYVMYLAGILDAADVDAVAGSSLDDLPLLEMRPR